MINATVILNHACNCASGLATPPLIMVATGLAVTQGALFRHTATIKKGLRMRTKPLVP